jgi:hypothetical protein
LAVEFDSRVLVAGEAGESVDVFGIVGVSLSVIEPTFIDEGFTLPTTVNKPPKSNNDARKTARNLAINLSVFTKSPRILIFWIYIKLLMI